MRRSSSSRGGGGGGGGGRPQWVSASRSSRRGLATRPDSSPASSALDPRQPRSPKRPPLSSFSSCRCCPWSSPLPSVSRRLPPGRRVPPLLFSRRRSRRRSIPSRLLGGPFRRAPAGAARRLERPGHPTRRLGRGRRDQLRLLLLGRPLRPWARRRCFGCDCRLGEPLARRSCSGASLGRPTGLWYDFWSLLIERAWACSGGRAQ